MNLYDFKKAETYIKDRIESIETAELGMREDWNWTASTIFEDGKFTSDMETLTGICGIDGSTWATPLLSITYKDGTDEEIECYTTDGEAHPTAQINYQKRFATLTGGRSK